LARFKIEGWPVLLFLDSEGGEINLIGGYAPPVEKYHLQVVNTLRGVDTFKSLKEQYAQGSRNSEMMTKLARKYNWKTGGRTQYLELLKEVVSVDLDGKGGTTEYEGKTLSCKEYAEFILAEDGSRKADKPDPALFQAFINKYPMSSLLKNAYNGLLSYYYYLPDREKAVKFYEGLMAKFPDDPDVLFWYVRWILKDKQNLDHGVELMEKIASLTQVKANIKADDDYYKRTLAELQLLMGDEAKAEEVFGKKTMQDKVSRLGYDLVNFARFWTDQDKNLETAGAMLETAIKLDPENPYFLQSATDYYFKKEQRERAEALYGPAYFSKISKDGSRLRIYASYWAERKEHLDVALNAARMSVELTPNAIAWDTLSLVLLTRTEYGEALKAAEKAIELDGGTNPRYQARLKQIKAAMAKDKDGEAKK